MQSYDIPKPDTGLAEWTNKIKAMQRQVDADEEAEQRRLEEEIAASRSARLHRSHAMNKSLALSKGSPSSFHDSGAAALDTIPVPERYISHYRTPRAKNEGEATTRIQSSVDTKTPPISLAAFMGGHATGPRLNRHAPQQDAHDPAQFDQHKHDFAPHPIFGQGGVAMPGMASRGVATNKTNTQVIDKSSNVAVLQPSTRRVEPASTAKREKFERGPVLRTPNSRERTTSTSALPSSSSSARVQPDLAQSRSATDLRKVNPDRGRGLATTAATKAIERPFTPHQEHEEPPKPPSKSTVTTSSLARPVHPQPRFSTSIPQMPPSDVPSPAFLRLPPQKDPTPSLSRLQGRGFVQSMVKVSKQLESPTVGGGSENSQQASGKRALVLDRWQPTLSARPSPSVPATPESVGRVVPVDSVSAASDRQHTPVAASPKKLKQAISSSSLLQTPLEAVPSADPPSTLTMDANRSPKGLGSATTLIVYKPTPLSPPTVDEFGLKNSTIQKSGIYTAGRSPASSGKPLSHPTKDRARKPRKPRKIESTPYPRKLTTALPVIEPPPSVHPGPPSTELSESPIVPLLTSKPLMTVKDVINVRTVVSQLAGMATVSPKLADFAVVPEPPSNRMIRRALPGLVAPERPRTTTELLGQSLQEKDPVFSDGTKPSSIVLNGDGPLVLMPSRHSRRPNAGNKATSVDLPQAPSTQSPKPESAGEAPPRSAANTRNLIPSAVHVEKRKSSQEKYITVMLPSLKEETTPTSSPARTLSHGISDLSQEKPADEAFGKPGLRVNNIDNSDILLPDINIEPLIKPPSIFSLDLTYETISTDMMLITGNAATAIPQNQVIFYDTELVAVVHRSKARTTGLVSTTVWAWRGKRCTLGEKENGRLQELAKRYGTSANIVQQHSEPSELVHVLGGQLAIRQGTRAHWTSEDTTMHLIRSKGGVIFIDEHDLGLQSLCSAFSYCLSILGTVYVWYGQGSTSRERQAALRYARSLELGTPTIELYEGGKNSDEVFWMVLGNEDFASADYWKWRSISSVIDPRIWRVDAPTDKNALLLVDTFSEESFFNTSVYIIDCVWELYVVVGSDARGRRQDIRLALRAALELSTRLAPARPYAPTVHVLIMPSQLPRDLRLNFRDLDELSVNNGNVPNYMNILSSMDALPYLQKPSWDEVAIQDQTVFPLEVCP